MKLVLVINKNDSLSYVFASRCQGITWTINIIYIIYTLAFIWLISIIHVTSGSAKITKSPYHTKKILYISCVTHFNSKEPSAVPLKPEICHDANSLVKWRQIGIMTTLSFEKHRFNHPPLIHYITAAIIRFMTHRFHGIHKHGRQITGKIEHILVFGVN